MLQLHTTISKTVLQNHLAISCHNFVLQFEIVIFRIAPLFACDSDFGSGAPVNDEIAPQNCIANLRHNFMPQFCAANSHCNFKNCRMNLCDRQMRSNAHEARPRRKLLLFKVRLHSARSVGICVGTVRQMHPRKSSSPI